MINGATLEERGRSLTLSVIKLPLQILILLFICLDLLILVVLRTVVYFLELGSLRGMKRQLLEILWSSKEYKEWKTTALLLDSMWSNDFWKLSTASSLYDAELIRNTTLELKEARVSGRHDDLIALLKHATKRNHGGSQREALYSRCFLGTQETLNAFHEEVEMAIDEVGTSKLLSDTQKLEFFTEIFAIYGQTVLSLSGGAAFSYYHAGVIKALFENDMLPSIITGSSAGALFAALVCTRTDDEILADGIMGASVARFASVMHDPWSIRLSRWWSTGAMFDNKDGFERMQGACKSMTFLEAYRHSGRVLCITTVPHEPVSRNPVKVLNYLTAPDVLISSAIVASSAVPGILQPAQLFCKDRKTGEVRPWLGSGPLWRDGSIRNDIPDLTGFSNLNPAFTIVSQVNPHISVFFYESEGSAGQPVPHRMGRGWRGGFIASAIIHHLDLDLKKWLTLLKDLRLLPPLAQTDIHSLFLQRFEGQVTILPASSFRLRDWFEMLENPSLARMEYAISQGQMKTFPKLAMIGDRMRTEQRIKSWIKKLI